VVISIHQTTEQRFQDEDLYLVERFVAGQSTAFQVIYEKYFDKVHSIARGVLGDHEDASDATQEVFTAVYRNLKSFDRRSKFSTWLFRVAVNRSIQFARSVKQKRRQVELTEAADVATLDRIPAIENQQVATCMRALNEEDRAILVLYYWHELSLQEIGPIMGCNPNAAKTRLFRARERFKAQFEKEDR